MSFQTIFLVVFVLFLYGMFRWRLMRSTHAVRVDVGLEAMKWASNPLVTEQAQLSLRVMAQMMYRPIAPWLVVAGLVGAAFCTSFKTAANVVSEDKETADQVLRLKLKLIFLLITTSPLACMAGIIVVLLGAIVRISVASVAVLSEVMSPKAVMQLLSAAGDPVFMISRTNLVRLGRQA